MEIIYLGKKIEAAGWQPLLFIVRYILFAKILIGVVGLLDGN